MLECNLDHPIERFCGELVDHIWNKETWDKAFSENMIIVCTAEILYKCLHHSYIQMSQINLLVFDEAHHTKKNHPYARIIKDFYSQEDDQSRLPKILGMTASPVDAQVDVHRAAAELEGLLHSQIVTASNQGELQRTICKPKTEIIIQYDRLLPPRDTELSQTLRPLLECHDIFRKAQAFAKSATSHLGPWCSDRFWELYLTKQNLPVLEAKTERNLIRDWPMMLDVRSSVSQVRKAQETVEKHCFSPASLDTHMLSSKVIELVNILRERFRSADSMSRCIIFVQQRWTAMMLVDLFQQPGIDLQHIQASVLVSYELLVMLALANTSKIGSNSTNTGDNNVSFRDQILTIAKFKKGELNCLVSTSVGEEGLDIPDCNTIIRFDLYHTMIQYIQSRGRARHEDSQYIHMIEMGNGDHRRKLAMNKINEQLLRQFCEALPDDRKLKGNDINMDYFLRKERQQRQYTVPSSGAKLNYKSSLGCLANFVASLPHPPETSLTPEYTVTSTPDGFQCEVSLPSVSPIRSALGRVHTTKQVAKCAAAFDMCLQLLKCRFLDDHLQPVFTKQLPAMRNARLAISSKKKDEYKMRTKPNIWAELGVPSALYVTVLTLVTPESLGRSSRPLLLLTRERVPDIASFSLFFGENRSSQVACSTIERPVNVGEDMLDGLTQFTLAIFRDVFSKEYEACSADMPYYLGPCKYGHDWKFSAVGDAESIIDWSTLKTVTDTTSVTYTGDEEDDFFKDKFVTDPWDGARKFFLRKKRHDFKPRDLVPASVVQPSSRAWRTATQDILNYSVSLWSGSRSRYIFREDQPVVEAELLPIRRNLLDDDIGDEDLQPRQCFLILEPLRISSVRHSPEHAMYCSTDIFSSCQLILSRWLTTSQ
jgi:endoribonuclease Dicer